MTRPQAGECFCLLGPNGAGKTTTIRMLTGVLGVSAGDAWVWGESLLGPGGMDRTRALMGVCPQFDVLWDSLTALEHLELFAAIKGLPGAQDAIRSESMALLRDVRLDDVAGKRAGQYSGGMRRRLSVAVALLGDPLFVTMDEPTTGMVRLGVPLPSLDACPDAVDILESLTSGCLCVRACPLAARSPTLGPRAVLVQGVE